MDILRSIKKELRFGLRGGKFIILAAGFFFFALLDPVMMKVVLPSLLQSQFPGVSPETFAGMFETSQTACVQSYMGDVFEIGTIITVFTLCGIIAQELKEKTLILPVCTGKSFGGIIASKIIVFGTALVIIMTAALMADYAYAGALMGFELPLAPIVLVGLKQGAYMIFILSCLMVTGSFLARPVASGIVTLAVVFGAHFVGGAAGIGEYIPTALLSVSSLAEPETGIAALLITAAVTALFFIAALKRLKSIELGQVLK